MNLESAAKSVIKSVTALMTVIILLAPFSVLAFGPAGLLTDEEQADAEAFCAAAGPEDCASAEQTCNDDPETCKANVQRARDECSSYGALCDMAKSYCQDPANSATCKSALLSGDPAGAMLGILTGGSATGSSGAGGGTGGVGGLPGTGVTGGTSGSGGGTSGPSVIKKLEDPLGLISGTAPSGGVVPMLIGRFVRLIVSISGSLALLMFIWGGFRFIWARGNDKEVQAAKDIITWSVSGLVVILLGYVIVSFIVSLLSGGAT